MKNLIQIDLIEMFDRILSVIILSYVCSRLTLFFNELTALINWNFISGFVLIINNVYSRYINYLEILFHELTHAFFALLSGNRIMRIFVSENEGFVEYRGRANWIITLSPYFFPLHTVALIYLIYLFELDDYFLFKVIILSSYLFYLSTVSKQFSFIQSDIQKVGIPYSILMMSCFHIILGFVMIFLIQGNLYQMVKLFV